MFAEKTALDINYCRNKVFELIEFRWELPSSDEFETKIFGRENFKVKNWFFVGIAFIKILSLAPPNPLH